MKTTEAQRQRRTQRHEATRVICRSCGRRSEIWPVGCWCRRCYQAILGATGCQPRCADPDRERRIALYSHRASHGWPLFSEPRKDKP